MHSPTIFLGACRLAVGGAFLAFPVAAVRLLGVDRASADRMSWLARMAAVRDLALGAGVLGAAVTQRGRVPALLATALTDAADAALIALAARDARVDRVRGLAMAAGAAGAAGAGIVAAADLLTRRRAGASAGVAREASRR
jgi:peptide-methionine (R)-S-oxide reductase